MVTRVIRRAFPEEIWVRGEIRDLNRAPSGHVYFNLADPEAGDAPVPVLPVTLFASEKYAVNRVLQRSGAGRMEDGIAVRIRGQVSHYAARGTVQLRMTWIDTDYTLGRLAEERERLVRSLEGRGLLGKNRELPLPLVPLRVGLVTSAGSAADADFTHELEMSGYAWVVDRYDARVQGTDAVPDVVRAIGRLAESEVDVIAVVRGGGAQTDLAAFDSEEIAVAIAECPIPVLTGIGHEIDVTVADLVARRHKTPTACATALVMLVTDFLARIDRLAVATHRVARGRLHDEARVVEVAAARLRRAGLAAGTGAERQLVALERQTIRAGWSRLRWEADRVDALATRVHRGGVVRLDAASALVGRKAEALGGAAARRVGTARRDLADLEHRVDLLDPRRLLARGWSITRTTDGNLLTSPRGIAAGTRLRTTLAGGELESIVSEETKDG
jgi:exodeoxyribonuclease VII large subunit